MKLQYKTRKGVKNRGVIVLLHGLGSSEDDLLSLSEYIPSDWDVICFRAPFAYGPGFSWFHIDWTDAGMRIDVDQRAQSLSLIVSELNKLKTDYKRVILGGFSQGAVMSLALLCQDASLADGAMIWSGRWPADFPVNHQLNNLLCIVQHGIYDEVLPVEGGRDIRDQLENLGATVEYHEYAMEHTISAESLRDALAWLKQQVR